jgi:trehalose-6-phosphate synthase
LKKLGEEKMLNYQQLYGEMIQDGIVQSWHCDFCLTPLFIIVPKVMIRILHSVLTSDGIGMRIVSKRVSCWKTCRELVSNQTGGTWRETSGSICIYGSPSAK